jgi:adenine-specific DNA-methyltransferase
MNNKTKLELTWIGKENRPRLEPRILVEDPDKSYHAKHKVTENDLFDNRLIFGDNLLALKALEQEFAGKVKCVYIDPPFNTGEMFENYEDGVEHSLWLKQMHERLELIYRMLSKDGSIFVHLNDDELDYCKVMMDEIFSRNNFLNRITIEARAPSAFSTVNPGVFKSSEYILWYAKNKKVFRENPVRVKRDPDYAYNKWIQNPDADCSQWQFSSILEAYESSPPSRSRRPDSLFTHFNRFIIDNASRIFRLASISDSGAGQTILEGKTLSLNNPGSIIRVQRQGDLDDVFIMDGQQIIFYQKNVDVIEGVLEATSPLTNIWTDIAWEGIAKEGDVVFRKGKKPERLLHRCLTLATNPGDLVLDSFLGSGTTAAVAHKMGRRWVGIELGEHCHTHCIPRLQKVIDGEDSGGITTAVGWKGGGGFRYFKLGPSLIDRDEWGNPIINKSLNPAMLAEAMCKIKGFRFDPSPEIYWQQGRSSEADFIYVTTQTLTRPTLEKLSEDVGPNRSLLICCGAFKVAADAFPNLTLSKIPKEVLTKCEYGRDDYSLEIRNLPDAPKSVTEDPPQRPRKKFGKQTERPGQPTLFDLDTTAPKGGE